MVDAARERAAFAQSLVQRARTLQVGARARARASSERVVATRAPRPLWTRGRTRRDVRPAWLPSADELHPPHPVRSFPDLVARATEAAKALSARGG